MGNLRRTLLLLLLSLILLTPLVLVLFLLWHNLPTDVTNLWTRPENRTGLIIGIISSLVYAIGASLFLFFRRAVLRWSKAFVLRGRSVDQERERVEQERLYLENFVERFRRDFPWEVNKYTDLEAIQEDLEKQAHRVQPLRRSLPNAEESSIEGNVRARVSVRSFLRSEKGPLMLKGEPGTGKTLTIRRFAVDQAENALKTLPDEVKIPIYIFLGSYTKKDANEDPEAVYDFLQHYLEEEYPASGFLREHLTEYLLQGRLLLLFDGLNELPLDEYLPRYKKLEEFVLHKYPKNKAIFTCRTIRYTSLYKFNTIVISDLANSQIKRFIAAYRGEAAAEILYRELTTGDGFMLRVCRNPFMLQMLVRRDPTRSVPQSPAQLFNEYVSDELRSITMNSEEMIDIMRQVAFTMQKDGKFAGTVTNEWLRARLPNIALDELLLIARKTQLVDYAPEKISFCHQILQEYFAALALKKMWEEGKDLESYFTDYRWDDTVLVCAGLNEETEQFIKGIWSPGKTSPDAFWLAMKAVGIGGRRGISEEYYDSLIREAERYLGLSGRAIAVGYSSTVLAVDTIKALSYIDDDQTAKLLNKLLVEQEGWLRELCIQSLGSSRNPFARSLLRITLISIMPYGDLFLAAPYFTRREWLAILANSVFSFKRFPDYILSVMTGRVKVLFDWLQALSGVILAFLLFLILDVLLTKAYLFGINLHPFSGRLLDIIFFLLIVRYHSEELAKIVCSFEHTKAKMKLIQRELTWFDLLFLLPLLLLWLFPTDTLLLLEILAIYLWLFVYYLAVITRLQRPPRLVSLIYFNSIGAAFLFAIVISWGLIPWVQNITLDNPLFKNDLMSAPAIRESISVLLSPFVYQVSRILISLIFVVTIVVFLATRAAYWRLQRYRKAYLYKNNHEAAIYIKEIAIKPSTWPQVRRKAFKELRLIELPYNLIEDLEKIIKDQRDYDVQRELERTVYELQARAREKDREGTTLFKRHVRALANQGVGHRKLEHYEEALADFHQAISLNEKDTELIVERGITYRLMKRYQEALADFDLALSLDQKDIQTLSIRAGTYQQMKRFKEALADWDKIIAFDEKRTWPYVYRGNIYRQMERYRESLADYARAIALNKKFIPALRERGLTLQSLGKYQEALDDFNRILALDENNIFILFNRGITYRLMKHYQEALIDLDHIASKNEKIPFAIAERGNIRREMGLYRDALVDLDHAINLNEKADGVIAERGEIYLLMGRYQEALADFDRAIALDRMWSFYHYDRALVSLTIGNLSDFERDLHIAMKLVQLRLQSAPDNWDDRLDLALYNLASGNTEDALAQYQQLASTCPLCLRLQNALNNLKDFLTMQPSNETAQHIHALLQVRIDELKQAPIR